MSPWPLPFWIAHRGAGKLAPENTLAAFRLGASHGYRAFECDVKLSGDGVAMLLHDADLQRTTNGHGRAVDHDWKALSRLDAGGWHGRRFAGEPLASLESIAQFCIANRFALNIEIKPTPGHESATGTQVAMETQILWHGSGMTPLLSSFAPLALEAAQAAVPELPRALLLDKPQADWLEIVQRLQCVAVVANHAIWQQQWIDTLHDAGKRALAYTVNDPATVQWLSGLGIDGLITDAVDRFSPAAEH
ncbi:MAG: glycerophosphodiester phosphodiesterase [Ideonella sp.]